MNDLRNDYLAACAALKEMAQLVIAAEAARFDAPPGMVLSRGETGSNVADVLNPTLDTVLDVRRMGLSDEVRTTGQMLRQITEALTTKTRALDAALARWEGDPTVRRAAAV